MRTVSDEIFTEGAPSCSARPLSDFAGEPFSALIAAKERPDQITKRANNINFVALINSKPIKTAQCDYETFRDILRIPTLIRQRVPYFLAERRRHARIHIIYCTFKSAYREPTLML